MADTCPLFQLFGTVHVLASHLYELKITYTNSKLSIYKLIFVIS